MIQLVKSGRKYNIIFKRFWNNVYRECNMRPFGINKNIDNPKFNYQLFQENVQKIS